MKYSKIIPMVVFVASSGVTAMEKEECAICAELRRPRDIVTLSCKHRYCRECLSQIVHNAVKAKNLAILRCPNPLCNHQLDVQEVRSITGDQKIADAVEDLNTQQWYAQQGFRNCPTPDCTFMFENEGFRHTVHCPKCKRLYCSECLMQHDDNLSCEEAKERDSVKDTDVWVKKFTKACPNCKARIEKNGGCPNMICEKCHHRFRWDEVEFDKLDPKKSVNNDSDNSEWIKKNTKPCPKCGTRIEKNGGCNTMHCTRCNNVFYWDEVSSESVSSEIQEQLHQQALNNREKEGLETAQNLQQEEENERRQLDLIARMQELEQLERQEAEEQEKAVLQVQEFEENEKREKNRQEQLRQQEIERNRQKEEQRLKEESRIRIEEERKKQQIEKDRIEKEKQEREKARLEEGRRKQEQEEMLRRREREEQEEAIRLVQEFEENEKKEQARQDLRNQQEIEQKRQKEKRKGKQKEEDQPREKQKENEVSDSGKLHSISRINLYPKNEHNAFLHNDFRTPFMYNGQSFMTVLEAFKKLARSNNDFWLMSRLVALKFISNQELENNLAEFPLTAQFINNMNDPYWGIGIDGKGKDMLGLILNGMRFNLNNNETDQKTLQSPFQKEKEDK